MLVAERDSDRPNSERFVVTELLLDDRFAIVEQLTGDGAELRTQLLQYEWPCSSEQEKR